MTTIAIDQAELDGLCGLPHLAFRVYVLLRSWMDFGTGLVGGPRGAVISYRRLAEHLEVKRDRGSTSPDERPSKEQLRAAVAQLVRKGMLRRIKLRGPRFVFCYRLLRAKVRPEEEPHVTQAGLGRVEKIAQCLFGKGFAPRAQPAYPPARKPEEHQPSGTPFEKRGRDWLQSTTPPTPWERQAVAMLRTRLQGREFACAKLPATAQKLAAILKVRDISERELDRAFALARRCRGVTSVSAYVVGILQQGELKAQIRREDARWPKAKVTAPPAVIPPAVQTPAGRERGLSALRSIASLLRITT